MPQIIKLKAKTILSVIKDGPDPYFGIKYNMNLYRGCQHGCIYCDSRSLVYGKPDLATIEVKENAIDLLRPALKSKRKKETVGTGSMNDPYMPIEKEERLTHQALKCIADCKFPIHIITKSDLVVRDEDLIKEIGKIYSAVSFSLSTTNDLLAATLEPGASAPSKRLEAMKSLALKGIYTGVVLSPVLPFISDTFDNIERIIKQSIDHGAKYILAWMGMTQREGQRAYFYNELDKHFPGLRAQYQMNFGNKYICLSPKHQELSEFYSNLCKKLNIKTRMEFYEDLLPKQSKLFGNAETE